MDSKDFRDNLIEVTIEGKQYALVPLTVFNEIRTINTENEFKFKSDIVEERFGLKDTFTCFNIYEITDPKKIMMAKIKYGV